MKPKKDTLFSMNNEELKEERGFSLLFLRVAFILVGVFVVVVTPLMYFVIALSSSLLVYAKVITCIIVIAIIVWGMWRVQFWAYLAFFIINLAPIVISSLLTDARFIPNPYGFALSLMMLISSWRIRDFRTKQRKKCTDQEGATEDATIHSSSASFTEQ